VPRCRLPSKDCLTKEHRNKSKTLDSHANDKLICQKKEGTKKFEKQKPFFLMKKALGQQQDF